MPSFGEKLRLEREKRKISLDQISSTTKIGTRMLQALEEEKFNQLPGGIFNKGFVRAYARAVGLDEDQAVLDYLQASGETPPPDAFRDSGTHEAKHEAARAASARDIVARHEENRIRLLEAAAEESRPSPPWGIFAVVLLVIALALSFWNHRRREQERQVIHPARTEVQSVEPSPQYTAPAASGLTTEPHNQSAATAANSPSASSPGSTTAGAGASTTSPTQPPEKPATSPQPTSPPQAPPPQSSTHQVSSAPSTPASGEFQVRLHARGQSWISVSIDGKFSGTETLQPGSDRTYPAHSRVFIKAGNSGAIDLELDGRKLDFAGADGEVRSVTIGPTGIIPPVTPPPSNP